MAARIHDQAHDRAEARRDFPRRRAAAYPFEAPMTTWVLIILLVGGGRIELAGYDSRKQCEHEMAGASRFAKMIFKKPIKYSECRQELTL